MAGHNSLNIPTLVNTVVIGNSSSNGLTTLGYSITPTANTLPEWDANKNLSANSMIEGYTTTATAATTTTLTISSTQQQYFTGSTTQIVILPVTSTLVLGQTYNIVNNSSGVVTVKSSGSNTIQAMDSGTQLIVTCISLSGTGTASWSWNYSTDAGSGTVTSVSVVSANGFAGTVANATTTPAITLSTTITGVLSGNGTAISGSAVSQYDVLVGGATNAISSVGPGSAGQVLQSAGNAANPAYSTATYPLTTTVNQVLYSSSANVVVGLATANSAVLATDGSGVPSLTATPTITSVTFGSGTALSQYVEGTFTPTVDNSTTPPTLTYGTQIGKYTRIGNRCIFNVVVSVLTYTAGSGVILIKTLPFTSLSLGGNVCAGAATFEKVTFGASVAYYVSIVGTNTTAASFSGVITTGASLTLDAAGAVATTQFRFSNVYQI